MLYRSNPPCTFVWNLVMDLNADLGFFLKEAMRKIGISQIGRGDLVYEYFNLKKRTLSKRPRRIVRSREFWYPQEYEQALEEFENDVRNGKNMSDGASGEARRNADFWGNHLHICEQTDFVTINL